MREIQKLVDDDLELQDLSKEQEQELKEKLIEHRALKETGARVSNSSAAADTRATMSHINIEVRLFNYSSPNFPTP
jgi:hypothetical protein